MDRFFHIADRIAGGGPLFSPVGNKHVSFDALPRVTQEDIAGEIRERFGEDDPVSDLRNLDYPPFALKDMPIKNIVGYARNPSALAVEKYVKMLEHSEAPPILVDGNRFVDGGHRYAAYVKAGRQTIPVVDVGPLFRFWKKMVEEEKKEEDAREVTNPAYNGGRPVEYFSNRIAGSIPRGLVLLKIGKDNFSIRGINNRRFVYNHKSGEILFGGSDISRSSHSQEWWDSGAVGSIDDASRGWIGYGGRYRDGVIHFSPQELNFNKGFDALQMFKRHGASEKTIVRNFVNMGEVLLMDILEGKTTHVATSIRKGSVLLKVGRDKFSIGRLPIRRFVYCGKTGEILFGGDNANVKSHSTEWEDSGAVGSIDDASRGWIGFGGGFTKGIIQFDPAESHFDRGYDTLMMFKNHGAKEDFVVRGFMSRINEMTLGEALGDKLRTAAKQTLDIAKIKQFRKDFLLLMSNANKAMDYDTAKAWQGYVLKWRQDFDDYLYKYLLRDFSNLHFRKTITDSDYKYWDKLIRERTWSFVVEFQVPLWSPDEYYSTEQRFLRFQHELARWKTRVMAKARVAWKVLEDFVLWYSSSVETGKAPVVDVPIPTKIEMEGFAVTVLGDDSVKSADHYISLFKRGLKIYRARAMRVYPWLIQNQLPIVLDFKGGLDLGGEYRYSYILMSGYLSGDAEHVAHILAHEMAHHRYKHLGSGERDFWENMIRGDAGVLDVREVVKNFPDETWIFENKKIMLSNPMLYYQLDGLRYERGVSQTLNNACTIGDLKKYLDEGGDPKVPIHLHPISSYASKSSEEAFCEALSYLVSYGPNSLPDRVLDWLRIMLPSSHTASARMAKSYMDLWDGEVWLGIVKRDGSAEIKKTTGTKVSHKDLFGGTAVVLADSRFYYFPKDAVVAWQGSPNQEERWAAESEIEGKGMKVREHRRAGSDGPDMYDSDGNRRMVAVELPDLASRYRHWNAKAFDGELPMVKLGWIKSIRRGGTTKGTRRGRVCTPESIEISSYLVTDEEKLDGILLHEMVHVKTMVKNGMDFGGSHGVFFGANLREAEAKAGRKIPLSDDLDDWEFSEDLANRKFGVLIQTYDDRSRIQVFNYNVFTRKMDEIKREVVSAVGRYCNHSGELIFLESEDRGLFKYKEQRAFSARLWFSLDGSYKAKLISTGKVLDRIDMSTKEDRIDSLSDRVAGAVIKLSPRLKSIPVDIEAGDAKKAFKEIESKLFHLDGPFYAMNFGDDGVVTLEIKEFDGEIHLAYIAVPPEMRNKGLASRAMRILTGIADKHGVKMNLDVSPQGEGGLTKRQLFHWYSKHGFKRMPYLWQKNTMSDHMERDPVKEARELLSVAKLLIG